MMIQGLLWLYLELPHDTRVALTPLELPHDDTRVALTLLRVAT